MVRIARLPQGKYVVVMKWRATLMRNGMTLAEWGCVRSLVFRVLASVQRLLRGGWGQEKGIPPD